MEIDQDLAPGQSIKACEEHLAEIPVRYKQYRARFMDRTYRLKKLAGTLEHLRERFRSFRAEEIRDRVGLDDFRCAQLFDARDLDSCHHAKIALNQKRLDLWHWLMRYLRDYFGCFECALEWRSVDRIKVQSGIEDLPPYYSCLFLAKFCKRLITMTIENTFLIVDVLTMARYVYFEHMRILSMSAMLYFVSLISLSAFFTTSRLSGSRMENGVASTLIFFSAFCFSASSFGEIMSHFVKSTTCFFFVSVAS